MSPPASNSRKEYPPSRAIGPRMIRAMLPAISSNRNSVGLNFQKERWNVPRV